MNFNRNIFIIASASLFCSGCATAFTRSMDRATGGGTSGKELAAVVAIDVVTLPVQAVVIPIVLVKDKLDEPERKRRAEQRAEALRILQEASDGIRQNPARAIEMDYLSKPPDSLEYRAFAYTLQTSGDVQFPLEFYAYIMAHSNLTCQSNIRVWAIRNLYIPQAYLVDEYTRHVNDEQWDNQSVGHFQNVLMQPRLPIELLEEAARHPNEQVARIAKGWLINRLEQPLSPR